MDKESKEINVFNNPMVQSAINAMTPEQLEEYQEMGKYMYSTTNFEEKNPIPKSLEQETVKGIFYIREALKAGLHPEELTKKELQLMYEIYGQKWYEHYGYEKDEVPSAPVTLDIQKQLPLTEKQIKKLEKMNRRKEIRKEKGNHKKLK